MSTNTEPYLTFPNTYAHSNQLQWKKIKLWLSASTNNTHWAKNTHWPLSSSCYARGHLNELKCFSPLINRRKRCSHICKYMLLMYFVLSDLWYSTENNWCLETERFLIQKVDNLPLFQCHLLWAITTAITCTSKLIGDACFSPPISLGQGEWPMKSFFNKTVC